MKKFTLSAAVIVAFFAYVLHKQFEGPEQIKVQPPKQNELSSFSTNTPVPSRTHSPRMTTMPMMRGQYKDGTYTGDVTDAYYGNVQVRVKISGGKMTDVVFLQYPNDRSTSIEINSQAMPYLKQEAIQAQNAQVDIVSGATQTSQAFRQSLQSALNQAS